MISAQQIQERRRDEPLRRQLGPQILAAIADPTITDIMVNDDGQVWYEAHGRLVCRRLRSAGKPGREPHRYRGRGTRRGGQCRASDRRRRTTDRAHPFRGIAPAGGAQALFRDAQAGARALHARQLCNTTGSSPKSRRVFSNAIAPTQNIVIGGGTGSGKTTLGGALINEMVELPIQRPLRDHRGHPRNPVPGAKIWCSCIPAKRDLTRLVRATMRLRPDRIIIGEVRGGEALALLKAWGTGHPGGVTTIHANSAGGTHAAFQSGAGSRSAAAARNDRRDDQAVGFHRAHAERPGVTEMVRVEGYDPREGFRLEDD